MIVEKSLDTSQVMMCRNAPSNSHNTGDFKLLLPIWQHLLGFKVHTFDSAIPLIRNLSSRNNSMRRLKKKSMYKDYYRTIHKCKIWKTKSSPIREWLVIQIIEYSHNRVSCRHKDV